MANHVVLAPANDSSEINGWRKMSFSEAVILNPTVSLDRDKTYPFVDMAAIRPGSRCVEAIRQRKYSGGGARFCAGDTLMARITPCLENGKIARYCGSDGLDSACGSTEFIVVRGRPEVTDPEFAYYLTRWEGVRGYAIGQMSGTSGRQRVATESLNHLVVPVPPLDEQRAIVRILGTLDDKIELNRRMAVTLEKTVRALFKRSFVDIGGDIPEGWDVKPVGHVCTLFGGATPNTKVNEYWHGGSHWWATPKDLAGRVTSVLIGTARRITDAGLQQISSGLLPKGTVLMSSRAPIGYLAIADVAVSVNQGFIAMVPKQGMSSSYLLNWCWFHQSEIMSVANGSTFMEVAKRNFRNLDVLVPTGQSMAAFERFSAAAYDRVALAVRESAKLASLRDTLSLKLISGQIRIRDAEKFIGAAT